MVCRNSGMILLAVILTVSGASTLSFGLEGQEDGEYAEAEFMETESTQVTPEQLMFMDPDFRVGETGSFGKRLEKARVKPNVHGYTDTWYRTNDFNRRANLESFNLHYFNVMVGAEIGDQLLTEILLEYEHGGEEVGVRYGILDYSPLKSLTLRAGKFLMPIGRFNEYLYPEYINKLADRPMCLWHIVPTVWAEVGVQARGFFNVTDGVEANYAVFAVNGLQQADGGEGGDIRKMRNNFRDSRNGKKSGGGRVGLAIGKSFGTSFSYYRGAYSVDGEQELIISDVEMELKRNGLLARGEYVNALEAVTGKDLRKEGFYAETSYRMSALLEPVVRYDQADVMGVAGYDGTPNTETTRRTTLGLVLYPLPYVHDLFIFKMNYSFIHDDGSGKKANELVLQTAIGF
ncbi:MAG: hypothetical protein V2A71_08070 [Candidatus Eisenbacteria bacterium]